MATLTLTTRDAVEAALSSPALVPPPPPPGLAAGPTADLRAAMARFGSGPEHERRRADVVRATDGLESGILALRSGASRATSERLTGRRLDVLADVAHRVPVEALARALGVGPGDAGQVVADVHAVVQVIGRGDASGPASDAAATRLLRCFRCHPAGAVAAASVLYQAHDATASLIAAMVVSAHDGSARRPAVSRTVRVAVDGASIAGHSVPAGTVVTLGLEDGLEFGAGPHACPGRRVAEALASGVVDALAESGYRLLDHLVETGRDGRPHTLPMEVPR